MNNRDMKIYINNIEFNTEHKIAAVELCALVHINHENASIIRRRHEDTVINISEILELQENDDFHITRNTLTTPDSAQGKFGRSIPESRINITDRIKTKIEPTKEDKPLNAFKNNHTYMALLHSKLQERDAKIVELEKWNVKQNAFIDKLGQENERLKSELDKAKELLSSVLGGDLYLECQSAIIYFLKDKR